MNINYDRVADAVYVNVSQGKIAKTVEMKDRVNIDLDQAGNIVGIELLEASSQNHLVKNLENNVANGVPISIVSATPVAA